jgi:ABC-type dipeptide/oligopeptide/nickel transport system permease component
LVSRTSDTRVFASVQIWHTHLTDGRLPTSRDLSIIAAILMTSFAFIFGLMPLWTALGAGGVARRLIGTVTIVGVAFSTAFAIFLVPMLFVIVERISQWSNGEKPQTGPPATAADTTASDYERAAGGS